MRVFAQTRFLLALNLMRLAIIAGLIQWSLGQFHLLGAVLVTVLATLLFKAAALIRMKRLLGVSAVNLLPWRSLGALLALPRAGRWWFWLVKSQIHISPLASDPGDGGGVYGHIRRFGLAVRFAE